MLELKVLNLASRLYRGVLGLTLRTLNLKDKSALRKYKGQIADAGDMRQWAVKLIDEAEHREFLANTSYDKRSRAITAAYNEIENAMDDFGSR